MLARGIQILQAFRPSDGGTVTLTTLVARTGLPKPTVYRLAQELVEGGLLEHDVSGYSLGLALLEISELVPVRRRLRETALPYMQDLYEATHETVHLGVRDGLDTVYAEKIRGHDGVDVPTRVGGRLPLSTTGLGKVLLAYAGADIEEQVAQRPLRRLTEKSTARWDRLERQLVAIRQTGIAYESDEAAMGVTCIACPITVNGDVLAAVSLSFRTPTRQRPGLEPALRAVTAGISRRLDSAGQPTKGHATKQRRALRPGAERSRSSLGDL